MTICAYTALANVPGEVRGQLSYPAEANFFLSFDWFELLFETSLKEAHSPRVFASLCFEGHVSCHLFCFVQLRNAVVRKPKRKNGQNEMAIGRTEQPELMRTVRLNQQSVQTGVAT